MERPARHSPTGARTSRQCSTRYCPGYCPAGKSSPGHRSTRNCASWQRSARYCSSWYRPACWSIVEPRAFRYFFCGPFSLHVTLSGGYLVGCHRGRTGQRGKRGELHTAHDSEKHSALCSHAFIAEIIRHR
jgi:hypothetical protein